MKYKHPGSFMFLLIVPFIIFGQNSVKIEKAQKLLSKSKTTFFIENKGQWPDEVKYLARIGGMNAWITKTGVVYDYYQIVKNEDHKNPIGMPHNKQNGFDVNRIKGQVVAMKLEGSDRDANILPTGQAQGYYNYIKGNNSANWACYVKQYREVVIEDIYEGIDIRYYFDNGLLRYDYIAKPGAGLEQLNIKIDGAESYVINQNGELTINTIIGNIIHGKLYSYQQYGNIKKEIACSFKKTENGHIGVAAENYDHTLALVIDPLVFSTFIGGSGEEYCTALDLDIYGNSYLTGYTRSTDYPASVGAYDTISNLGSDVFISKLNEAGNTLFYSTYISADSNEAGNSIVVDSNGNVYITGYTQSSNYPVTSGAFDISYNGGSNFGGDGFITKLDATGTSLIYSTFLGGLSNDNGISIVLDAARNVLVTGYTKSPDYPFTSGAYDTSLNGTNTDLFITKMNSSGSSLIYSTFIGGSFEETGNSIVIDINGNAYVTGYTASTDYPTTAGSFDVSQNGAWDVFVTKINSTGNTLLYSTFIGGTSLDVGASIAIDNSDNAYLTGYTISSNFPTTIGAYDIVTNGLFWDAFVTKLNSLGKAIIYSTYLGGNEEDLGYSIKLDSKGNAFIAGKTLSSTFPFTSGAFDGSYNGGSTDGADGFLTTINSNGSALIYSTFMGGTDEDFCTSVALDVIGTAFIAGNTMSAGFPSSAGAYDITHNGDYDAFLSCIFFPIKQATGLSFKNISGAKADISWMKGTGTKRAVFIKQGTYGVAKPLVDVTYTANDTFALGSQVDTSGWYCIYNDTGTSTIVYGLNQLSTYRVMVCDYIGLAGNEHYNTDSVNKNPANFTTIYATPTIQATDIFFSNITDTSFTITFTKGNGPKRVVFMKVDTIGKPLPVNNTTYNAKPLFGQGSQIGFSGWYCVYNDTGNTVTVRKLQASKTYRVMVCDYNGIPTKEQYQSNVASGNPSNQFISFPKPSVQASNIIFTNITKTSVNIAYTRGNGGACLLLMTTGTTPYPPLQNNTTYTVNSEIGTSGWFCKYKGALKVFSLTGLAQDTFRIMVCEYNGTAGFEIYNTDTALKNPNSFTTVLVGINDIDETDLSIYPNPTNGMFIVKNANGCSIKIFNTLGKEIYSGISNEDDFEINIFDQKDGIYFVRLEKEGTLISKNLILKR